MRFCVLGGVVGAGPWTILCPARRWWISMQVTQDWNPKFPLSFPGIVFMPGTMQLTSKDLLYRLQVSKAKGIITTDTFAPEVDSLASRCPTLKTKLLVSDHSCQGWLDLRSSIKWVSVLMNVLSKEGQEKAIHSQPVGGDSPGLMAETFSS